MKTIRFRAVCGRRAFRALKLSCFGKLPHQFKTFEVDLLMDIPRSFAKGDGPAQADWEFRNSQRRLGVLNVGLVSLGDNSDAHVCLLPAAHAYHCQGDWIDIRVDRLLPRHSGIYEQLCAHKRIGLCRL